MSKSFSDNQTELKKLIEYYIEQQKKPLTGTRFPHTYMIEPRSQATYFLEPETIYTYLEIAIETQRPLLSANTFYLHDLSTEHQTPYNSLVFEINGQCFKSKDTTSQIIERFSRYHEKPYELTHVAGQLIGLTQQCPYSIGDLFFAPVNEANWLGMHHVTNTSSHGQDTNFLIKNNHELTLPLNRNAVENIVESTYLLYHFERIFVYNILNDCNRHYLDEYKKSPYI